MGIKNLVLENLLAATGHKNRDWKLMEIRPPPYYITFLIYYIRDLISFGYPFVQYALFLFILNRPICAKSRIKFFFEKTIDKTAQWCYNIVSERDTEPLTQQNRQSV